MVQNYSQDLLLDYPPTQSMASWATVERPKWEKAGKE